MKCDGVGVSVAGALFGVKNRYLAGRGIAHVDCAENARVFAREGNAAGIDAVFKRAIG